MTSAGQPSYIQNTLSATSNSVVTRRTRPKPVSAGSRSRTLRLPALPPRFVRTLRLLARSFLQSLGDFVEAGSMQFAAAIAFYALLGIFPFLLLLAVISGRLLEDPDLASRAFSLVTEYIPGGGRIVRENVRALQDLAGRLGLVSLIGLVWSSMGLFGSIRRALDHLSGESAPKGGLVARWIAFLAVVFSSLGLLLAILLGTVASLALGFLERGLLGRIIPVAVTSTWLPVLLGTTILWLGVLLTLAFLPRRRPGLMNCWFPALVVALLLERLKIVFVWFLGNTGSYITRVHGPLAVAIALMLWAFLTAQIFLFGGAWAYRLRRLRIVERRRRSVP